MEKLNCVTYSPLVNIRREKFSHIRTFFSSVIFLFVFHSTTQGWIRVNLMRISYARWEYQNRFVCERKILSWFLRKIFRMDANFFVFVSQKLFKNVRNTQTKLTNTMNPPKWKERIIFDRLLASEAHLQFYGS